MVTLRRQELVSFSYSNFADAEVTYLGKQIICNFSVSQQVECPFQDVVQASQVQTNALAGLAPQEDYDRALVYCNENLSNFEELVFPYEISTEIGPSAGWILRGDPDLKPDSDYFYVDVSLEANGDQDPYALLFEIVEGPEGTKSCSSYAEDDNGGDGRNAWLRATIADSSFPTTDYALIARDRAFKSSQDQSSDYAPKMTLTLSTTEGN